MYQVVLGNVGFEVFTAVTATNVAPRGFVINRRFGGTCQLTTVRSARTLAGEGGLWGGVRSKAKHEGVCAISSARRLHVSPKRLFIMNPHSRRRHFSYSASSEEEWPQYSSFLYQSAERLEPVVEG
jgi:hypothetical protein